MKSLLVILLTSITLIAQLPVKITDGNGNASYIAPSGRQAVYLMQLVPTSSTAIVTSTIKVQVIFCANITGTAATLTITDNQGSPVTYFPAVSIAANTAILLHSSVGMTMTTGVKWTSGTISSIYCQIEGVH